MIHLVAAAERATGFVATEASSAEALGSTGATALVVATGLAVAVSVVLLLLCGARSRESATRLDRLDSLLEERDVS